MAEFTIKAAWKNLNLYMYFQLQCEFYKIYGKVAYDINSCIKV